MEFAHRELSKRGWKDGKGLGKGEDGIATAIKCKLKLDNSGLGHDPGEQFTYNWWEHVFKKALDRVNVEEKGGEVNVVSSRLKKSENTVISSSRSSALRLANRGLVYGRFVKASDIVEESGGSESESDDDSRNTAAAPDLLKACEGRTANRAARHGLGLNGKLKRIQMQEDAFSASVLASPKQSAPEDDVRHCCSDCGCPIRKQKYREIGRCRSCSKSCEKSEDGVLPCCNDCGCPIQREKYKETGSCRSCSKSREKRVGCALLCCNSCGNPIRKRKYREAGRCRSCSKEL